MTDVTIYRTESGNIQSFEISGHAFFADRGEDIVCAGISAVSIGSINAIHEITGVTPETEVDYEKGLLRCAIPEDLPVHEQDKIHLLLEGMYFSLKTIEEEYGEHIKITFKKQEVE